MQKPIDFYSSQKLHFEDELSHLKKQLATSSTIRLLVFLAVAICMYFFFGAPKAMVITAVIAFLLFLYLVSRHSSLQAKKDLVIKLIEINTVEMAVLKREYLSLDDGAEFIDHTHAYSYDIDLFGRGSLFQYLNRTSIREGRIQLFQTLTDNNILNIKQKQETIKELSEKPKWRQQFSAIASLVNIQHSAKEIVKWIHGYQSVLPRFLSFLPTVFSTISLLLIASVSFELLNFNILLIWFFIGLGISGVYLKKVNTIYKDADSAKDTFKQYYKLLSQIEDTSFNSQVLQEKQTAIKTETKKASAIFASFSKILDALDQRNNLLIAVLGNAFFLRDMQQAYKVEQWIKLYATKVEKWFEAIAFFDAQNSLGNFAFNHPNYTYPQLSKHKNVIKAEMLGHPLLKAQQRVDNNFSIENQQFFIITGANMAGKSTFLRTVSLAIVMANIGLPVCSKSFEYAPIQLITSMRTSDSLADDTSYFFSELKRLKFIVDEIKNRDFFIILDEILKGTNSTDKAIGSKKFVQKLVASNSTGIIATHDLSLCEIEKELPVVHNYYFDAEIVHDELHFDYQTSF